MRNMGNEAKVPETYDSWLARVNAALQAINMPMDDWQRIWSYDFAAEYKAATDPAQAADKANKFWWREQNRASQTDCRFRLGCWLPRGHQGQCEPISF